MMALFAVGSCLAEAGSHTRSLPKSDGHPRQCDSSIRGGAGILYAGRLRVSWRGVIRAKNTVNYMTKSFLDFCIASLGFWAFGYALMFGGGAAAGIIGLEGFFLANFEDGDLVNWFFQMVFAGTAATIIAGAMRSGRRLTLTSLTASSLAADLPDIRALGVERLRLACRHGLCRLRGFRRCPHDWRLPGFGWRDGSRTAQRLGAGHHNPGHNVPYVVIGTFILFFGWFGFNINSATLGLNAVNTLLAGSAGRLRQSM